MSTQDLEASMRKSVEATQRNFNTIRTGRANSSLLDRISVEYYGADTPLKSLATLSTPDSQTIQIQPFDISALASIEKAIAMSELGFTPNNDGKIIRINVPPLTEERRKEFCKLASKYAEEGKVAQTIQIQPFDISALASIEKAIAMSELGFTPNNDGKIIRINVPPLTEERRKEFCKLASKYAEEGKVALRNLRRDAIDKIKKQEKEGEFSEDQSRDEQDGVQKTLDKFIAELEKHLATKEADILKV